MSEKVELRSAMVSQEVVDLWKSINSKQKIDRNNWMALTIENDENLVVSGTGRGGIEEIREKVIKENVVTYVLLRGCNVKSKKDLETLNILISWIPDGIRGLKRAMAILFVDDIVNIFSLNSFCLIEPKLMSQVNRRFIVTRVNEIRGVEHAGKYSFDEKVYSIRCAKLKELREKFTEPPSEKMVEKLQKGEVNVLREILSTERSYVFSMRSFRDCYVEDLRKHGHADLYSLINSNVNTILQINEVLLSKLCKVYEIDDKEGLENEKEFLKKLSTLDADFFSDERVHSIADVFFNECGSFRFYSLYVNAYPKMLHRINKVSQNNSKLKKHFKRVNKKLKLSFESFLIMPIQRIPRYSLLLRELLRKTHPTDPVYPKIEKSMEAIKEVADLINQNKQTMIMIKKTIHLSKKLKRPGFMKLRMIKYKDVNIIKNKMKRKKKKSTRIMLSAGVDEEGLSGGGVLAGGISVSSNPGEAYVFDKSFIVVKNLSPNSQEKRGDEDDDLALPKYIKLHCEVDLENPAVRVYKHRSDPCILEIEDDVDKFRVQLNSSSECESLIEVTQQVLSKFLQNRVYQTRPLFRSYLKYKKDKIENRKKMRYFVLNADQKIKMYHTKVEYEKEDRMRKSFSIVNAKFGKVDYSKLTQDNEKYQERKRKEEKSRRGTFKRGTLAISGGQGFSIPGIPVEEDDEEEDEYMTMSYEERKQKEFSCWFQITIDNPDGKKGKTMTLYFQARTILDLETWIGILERIGCCERVDEIDEDLEINQLFMLFQAGLTQEFKKRAGQESLKSITPTVTGFIPFEKRASQSLAAILSGSTLVVKDDEGEGEEEEEVEGGGEEVVEKKVEMVVVMGGEDEAALKEIEDVTGSGIIAEPEGEKGKQELPLPEEEVIEPAEVEEVEVEKTEEAEKEPKQEKVEKTEEAKEAEPKEEVEEKPEKEEEEKVMSWEEKYKKLQVELGRMEYRLNLERQLRVAEKRKSVRLIRQCFLLKKENEVMSKELSSRGIEVDLGKFIRPPPPPKRRPPGSKVEEKKPKKKPGHKPPSPPVVVEKKDDGEEKEVEE